MNFKLINLNFIEFIVFTVSITILFYFWMWRMLWSVKNNQYFMTSYNIASNLKFCDWKRMDIPLNDALSMRQVFIKELSSIHSMPQLLFSINRWCTIEWPFNSFCSIKGQKAQTWAHMTTERFFHKMQKRTVWKSALVWFSACSLQTCFVCSIFWNAVNWMTNSVLIIQFRFLPMFVPHCLAVFPFSLYKQRLFTKIVTPIVTFLAFSHEESGSKPKLDFRVGQSGARNKIRAYILFLDIVIDSAIFHYCRVKTVSLFTETILFF